MCDERLLRSRPEKTSTGQLGPTLAAELFFAKSLQLLLPLLSSALLAFQALLSSSFSFAQLAKRRRRRATTRRHPLLYSLDARLHLFRQRLSHERLILRWLMFQRRSEQST